MNAFLFIILAHIPTELIVVTAIYLLLIKAALGLVYFFIILILSLFGRFRQLISSDARMCRSITGCEVGDAGMRQQAGRQ